ncbi:MAG: DnaA/Hda family protein [bacterium]
MIDSYKLVYSPTADKRFRYKVKISGDETDCKNIIRNIGPICGSPFKSLDSNFAKAFYVYGSALSVKEQIIKAIDEYAKQKIAPSAQGESSAPSAPQEEKLEAKTRPAAEKEPAKKTEAEKPVKLKITQLRENYTFDALYEGGFNRFLKQACENIAREFDPSYNPLFIWGGVGLGKSHLINAIGNFIKKNHEDKVVLYVQAQDLMSAIARVKDFSSERDLLVDYLAGADALLVDDIQFLEGDVTQDVFFAIFERAYHRQAQIVLTADRSPKQLSMLTDRLRSRFEWGLVNKLFKPDYKSRVGILKMKISREFSSLNMSEQMLDFIAKEFEDNVRELEGALKKINIYCQLRREPVTMEEVKEIVLELKGEASPAAASGAIAQPAPQVPGASPGVPPAPSDIPPPPGAQCPNCGGELSYIEMYDRWYCYGCKNYAPPDFGNEPVAKEKKQAVDEKKRLEAIAELKALSMPQKKKAACTLVGTERKTETVTPADITYTRAIQCVVFYPAGEEKEVNNVTGQVLSTVTKHRLYINFEFIVQQEYEPVKLNFSSFINILNTAKLKVAVVIGPPASSDVNEDKFYEMLNGIFTDEDLCLEYIAFKDIGQSYEYLNIVLDMANFGKQRLGYKILKDEMHSRDGG